MEELLKRKIRLNGIEQRKNWRKLKKRNNKTDNGDGGGREYEV